MEALRVLQLEVENFMGVKAVEITPNKDVIKIEGKNGQGKSSVINSIWAAVGGKAEEPVHPIRNGEADARIFVDLGEINVTRKFKGKNTYLEVKNADGLEFPRPQETLDRLFSKVSMDPQEFISKNPRDRLEFLLDLTGKRTEIEALDSKCKDAYDERTIINREIKTLEGKLEGAPNHGDIKEKSMSELLRQLEVAQNDDERIRKLKQQAIDDKGLFSDNQAAIAQKQQQIKTLTDEIAALEKENDKITSYLKNIGGIIKEAPPSKVSDIQAELETAEYHNAKVREMETNTDLRQDLKTNKSVSSKLTKKIDATVKEKFSILKSNIPIANVAIENGIIYLDGTPFDDLSDSEQIRASIQIGISQNPTLRVLKISNGGELDSDTMKIVEKFAADNNCQIWVQKVCDEPQDGIFIEEGEVLENTKKKG